MNTNEMYEALEQGKCVRRPSWRPDAYMKLNSEGVEETYFGEKLVAMGYRDLGDSCSDWEIVSVC